jgi:hypothetical protein
MSLDRIPLWVISLLPPPLWVLIYFILIALLTAVSGCLLRIRMRRRIKKDLGREVYDGDLTSIGTWMKVDAVEEKNGVNRDWIPKSRDLGFVTLGICDARVRFDEVEEEWRTRESGIAVLKPVDNYVTLIDLGALMGKSSREFASPSLRDLPTRLFRIKYDSKTRKRTG